jgi:hypothetical protein
MPTKRWSGVLDILDLNPLKAALPFMSDKQLQFYANVCKVHAPDAHKLVLEECSRRVALAYVEEGLGG